MDPQTNTKMVEQFCCPGCVAGSNTDCGVYEPADGADGGCRAHVAGTLVIPGGKVYLGMPKGFTKVGAIPTKEMGALSNDNIRLWAEGTDPGWNHLNVPVWAHEEDGHLFVRTFLPRLGVHYIDVIAGGTLAMVPGAINVADFADQID